MKRSLIYINTSVTSLRGLGQNPQTGSDWQTGFKEAGSDPSNQESLTCAAIVLPMRDGWQPWHPIEFIPNHSGLIMLMQADSVAGMRQRKTTRGRPIKTSIIDLEDKTTYVVCFVLSLSPLRAVLLITNWLLFSTMSNCWSVFETDQKWQHLEPLLGVDHQV